VASLPNLERLYLDMHYFPGALPRHLLVHDRLVDLSLNYNYRLNGGQRGGLTSVADEAFYYLPSLATVDLLGQQIAHLARDAFRFQADSAPISTAIFLEDNRLTEDSFEVGTFSCFRHRQLTLFLGGNNIT